MREQGIIVARRLFQWRHTGFAANGDAVFEVFNASQLRLPYLSIGVRGPNLLGGAWLDVSGIAPGSRGVVHHDCYKKMLRKEDVAFFAKTEPTPETRDRFWEFRRLARG